jgi:hypothetical protein
MGSVAWAPSPRVVPSHSTRWPMSNENALAVNVGVLGVLAVLFAGNITERPIWVEAVPE